MIDNISISNLQVFNNAGRSLACPDDLQKKIQERIANKVENLLSEEFMKVFIPNYNPDEEIKLRIHLTKAGITVEVANTENTKKNSELSGNITTRKKEIIKTVNSLFTAFTALPTSNTSALRSKKVHPLSTSSEDLSISSEKAKEKEVPFTIGFDANISGQFKNQALHAKIKALQDQLNKQETSSSERYLLIKEHIQLLKQAIENLANKQNVPFSNDFCQMLLNLLAKTLNQSSNNPIPSQNSALKDIISKLEADLLAKDEQISELGKRVELASTNNQKLENQLFELHQEKEDLEENYTSLTNKAHEEATQLLAQKQQEIDRLKEELQVLPSLQSQLSSLQQEKEILESAQNHLKDQLDQAHQNQTKSSSTLQNAIKELKDSSTSLQADLLAKDEKIFELNKQIQTSSKAFQELTNELSKLQQEKADLQQEKNALDTNLLVKDEKISELNKQIQTSSKAFQELTNELSKLQQEKNALDTNLLVKDEKISELNKQIQTSSEAFQELTNELSKLQQEKNALDTNLLVNEQILTLQNQLDELQNKNTILQNENKMLNILLEDLPKSSTIDAIDQALATSEGMNALSQNSSFKRFNQSSTDYYNTIHIAEDIEEDSIQPDSSSQNKEAATLAASHQKINPPTEAHDQTKIEKMERAIKDLTKELSEKTTSIKDLGDEIISLHTQLKKLQRLQRRTSEEKQQEITTSSEENDYLIGKLDEKNQELLLERKKRAELEESHKDQLEKLEDLYKETALARNGHITTMILQLQEAQKSLHVHIAETLAGYVLSGSITQDTGNTIIDLIDTGSSFTNYQPLLDLVASEQEKSPYALSNDSSPNSDEEAAQEFLSSWID